MILTNQCRKEAKTASCSQTENGVVVAPATAGRGNIDDAGANTRIAKIYFLFLFIRNLQEFVLSKSISTIMVIISLVENPLSIFFFLNMNLSIFDRTGWDDLPNLQGTLQGDSERAGNRC